MPTCASYWQPNLGSLCQLLERGGARGQRGLQVRENACLSRRGHGVGAVAVLPFLRHGSFPAQQRKKNDCKSVRHCTKQVEVCYTDAHSQTLGIRHLPGNICPLHLLDMIKLTLTGCFYVLGSLLNTTCICPSKLMTEGPLGSFVIVEEIQVRVLHSYPQCCQ